MEQYENYDDVPLEKISLDVRSMETDAHNDESPHVKAFIEALAQREQKSWPAEELLNEFESMPEYLKLLKGIIKEEEINEIRWDIYSFLDGCIDIEIYRMKHNAQPPPDMASAIVEEATQPVHLEEIRVNLYRLLALMKRESMYAGEDQKNLYAILHQMYEEMRRMTDAEFLIGEVHGRLKEANWNDIERPMKLLSEYIVRTVAREKAFRENRSIDQVADQIQTTLNAFIQTLNPSSPDTTPPSTEAHPQN